MNKISFSLLSSSLINGYTSLECSNFESISNETNNFVRFSQGVQAQLALTLIEKVVRIQYENFVFSNSISGVCYFAPLVVYQLSSCSVKNRYFKGTFQILDQTSNYLGIVSRAITATAVFYLIIKKSEFENIALLLFLGLGVLQRKKISCFSPNSRLSYGLSTLVTTVKLTGQIATLLQGNLVYKTLAGCDLTVKVVEFCFPLKTDCETENETFQKLCSRKNSGVPMVSNNPSGVEINTNHLFSIRSLFPYFCFQPRASILRQFNKKMSDLYMDLPKGISTPYTLQSFQVSVRIEFLWSLKKYLEAEYRHLFYQLHELSASNQEPFSQFRMPVFISAAYTTGVNQLADELLKEIDSIEEIDRASSFEKRNRLFSDFMKKLEGIQLPADSIFKKKLVIVQALEHLYTSLLTHTEDQGLKSLLEEFPSNYSTFLEEDWNKLRNEWNRFKSSIPNHPLEKELIAEMHILGFLQNRRVDHLDRVEIVTNWFKHFPEDIRKSLLSFTFGRHWGLTYFDETLSTNIMGYSLSKYYQFMTKIIADNEINLDAEDLVKHIAFAVARNQIPFTVIIDWWRNWLKRSGKSDQEIKDFIEEELQLHHGHLQAFLDQPSTEVDKNRFFKDSGLNKIYTMMLLEMDILKSN
jgi:hypothetical protein